MLIQRGYRFRLAPTSEQASTLAQYVGACRFVYNLALEQRRDWYRPGRRIDYLTQAAELTKLRSEVDWIDAVPVNALQQALRDLDRAFVTFFEGRAAYPTPRVKGINDSFRVPQSNGAVRTKKLNASWSTVRLPKIGWVKYRAHREIKGEICNATVSLNGEHWWISIQTEREIEVQPSTLPHVGIDRGITVLAALSTGELIEPGSALMKHSRRLKNAQRVLSRRKKGSNRWRRQKARVNRIHTQVANTRKDQLHKITFGITRRFGTVVVEALKIKNMTASAAGTVDDPGRNVAQKSGLNRVIMDKGWHGFEMMLAYKLQERGGTLVRVNPAYTSQTCSSCGMVDRISRESQAVFRCVACGHAENADCNAAKNILRAEVRPLSAPSELRKRPATRTTRTNPRSAAWVRSQSVSNR